MTTLLRPLILALFACTAQAQSVVDVARCTIEANNRLPSGAELKKAERECYNILGKNAQAIYNSRHKSDERVEHNIVIEVRQNPLQAPQAVHRHHPIEHGANTVYGPRAYPYRYPSFPYDQHRHQQ